MCYAVLEHRYTEEDVAGEVRHVLQLPPLIAPVQVAVLPLMARDGLDVVAREIVGNLKNHGFLAEYDDSGAIGRRYRRQDEIGTPFAITVDYDTLEEKTVTLRDRDTMLQVRIAIDRIPDIIRSLVDGSTSFGELQQ
jgi:glycyl-tRNA synthetase